MKKFNESKFNEQLSEKYNSISIETKVYKSISIEKSNQFRIRKVIKKFVD